MPQEKIGAVLVTVNTSYRAQELEYLLQQSDTTTLILTETFKGTSYLDILNEILPELKNSEKGNIQSSKLPKLKNVILLSDEDCPGCYNWQDLIQLGERVTDRELEKRQRQLHYRDVINMQYTSGTTGFPKGYAFSLQYR